LPSAPKVHRPIAYQESANRTAKRPQKTTTERGYNWRWRKVSQQYLRKFPLCRACEDAGRITAATEVDHIRPHDGDQALFWAEDNWQPLCKRCHSRKTAGELGLTGSSLAGWIGRIDRPLTVVAGPPAAGKTTYVSERASADDLVLDLDEIAVEIGLESSRDRANDDRNSLGMAIRERNSRLADFAKGRTRHPRCWLIATAGSFRQRQFWTDLGAELVVVNPGAVVCKARVRAEKGPETARAARLKAIDQWS